MEKSLEERSSSGDKVMISEEAPVVVDSVLKKPPMPHKEDETYPPQREVVPIMCALGAAMFLVALVIFCPFHSWNILRVD